MKKIIQTSKDEWDLMFQLIEFNPYVTTVLEDVDNGLTYLTTIEERMAIINGITIIPELGIVSSPWSICKMEPFKVTKVKDNIKIIKL